MIWFTRPWSSVGVLGVGFWSDTAILIVDIQYLCQVERIVLPTSHLDISPCVRYVLVSYHTSWCLHLCAFLCINRQHQRPSIGVWTVLHTVIVPGRAAARQDSNTNCTTCDPGVGRSEMCQRLLPGVRHTRRTARRECGGF
jgi:hypothetical protein